MDGAQVVAKTAGRAALTGTLVGAAAGAGIWTLFVIAAAVLGQDMETLGFLVFVVWAVIIGGSVGTLIGMITAFVLVVYIAEARRRHAPGTVARGIRSVSVGVVTIVATLIATRVFTGTTLAWGPAYIAGSVFVTAALAFAASRRVARTYLRAEHRASVTR
jgi:hypothetical protein